MLVSAGGVSGVHAGKKHGFASTSTEAARALEDPDSSAVVIATRHDSHAQYVVRAIEQRKHVFVEKPMALSLRDALRVRDAAEAAERRVMVGFVLQAVDALHRDPAGERVVHRANDRTRDHPRRALPVAKCSDFVVHGVDSRLPDF